MCIKLPVELRDMIYSYLDIKQRFQVNCGFNNYDANFHSFEGIQVDDVLRKGCIAFEAGTYDVLQPGGWLVNPDYVGHGMAREIAEKFYTVNDFHVSQYFLANFLTTDRTQTGMKPYEYIRGKLAIVIETTRCNGGSERAWQSTENEVAFLNNIYNNLNPLTLLTHKSQISIDIYLSTSSPLWEPQTEGDRRFYNIMETIREPIYDLIHAGFSVTVEHTAKSSLHRRNISGKSPNDLNYFKMGRVEWEVEKNSHEPNWLPSTNFVSREENDEIKLSELLKQRWDHEKSIDAYGC